MWLLPLFVCAWLAEPKSAGIYLTSDEYACEFDGPGGTAQWGCQTRTWNYTMESTELNARLFCQDSNANSGKMMWWTAAPLPVPDAQFTMRTGNGNPLNDVRSYVPNGFIAVYVRALQFDNLYKGLILYARSSSGNKTGDWILPYEESPAFQVVTFPNKCLRTVMHLNAEDKPYVAKFTFVAPGPGAGPITIKAMIKTGPPNPTDVGNFYRMKDIVLSEAQPFKQTKSWNLLNASSGSCTQFCKDNGQDPCSEKGLSSSMDLLEPSPTDILYPCHGAVFHNCQGNPRVELPGRFCTYHPSNCNTGASCSKVPDGITPLFCYCGEPPVLSASSTLVPGLGALIALLSMGMWGSKSQLSWGMMAVLFAAAPIASAHNWMEGTRGRASNLGANQFCSPTFPQVNRNAIHLQVAQNQNFVVEWAAAHGDYTYWIVIPDSARANVSMLTRKFMDDWLKGCPTGGFANTTATGMKYHRFGPNRNLASNSLVNGQSDGSTTLTYAAAFLPTPIYDGPVWDAHAINGNRPASFFLSESQAGLRVVTTAGPDVILPFNASLFPRSMLAEYNKSLLLDDRRCTYKNSSYPWVETIHRYRHHDVSAAFATAILNITGPPGRYQVHYKWSSYCDVMDVDVKSGAIVAAPYGIKINATDLDFDVAHHCWFEKPRTIGQCFEVVTTPEQCEAICSAHSSCRAFQMLPLQLDNSQGDSFGKFPEKSFIPWDLKGVCDKSQFSSKAAKNGSMICYPIYEFQNDFNSARPLWSFTDDPDHQGFYGTCYIKPRPVTFINPGKLVVDPLDEFRFKSKCVPCDNIGQNLTNPRWGPAQDFCTDCKAFPVPPRRETAVPAWRVFAVGTFNQPAHWLSPAGTPIAFADECAVLASRDSTCSKYVMYSDVRAQRYSGKSGVLLTNANVNGTNAYKLINTSVSYHYTAFSVAFAYYRTCACLNLPAAVDASPPTVDVNATSMACDGVKSTECIIRNFTIYQLS